MELSTRLSGSAADDDVLRWRMKMGSMSDKIFGKADGLAGKVRQAVGDATRYHEIEAEGAVQEAKGMFNGAETA
jgi:uncharacterized protein YjbJ (UPF0337 family)